MIAIAQIQLEPLDWIVFICYALAMLLIGWFYSHKNKTNEDYLLGGRSMNPTAVGVSLFATLLSTLSYLTYPGEMIRHGPLIFMGLLAFPLIYYVGGWWLIPRIMKMNVTSAYEILEHKLGLRVRMFGIFMFLSLRILWMSTIIYMTVEIALLPIIQFDSTYIPYVGILLTGITIIYTTMGGLRGVVVTDVLQSIIFLVGAILCIVIISFQLGSVIEIFPKQWMDHWDTLHLGFDPLKRTTLGNAVIALFVWYLCTLGSDQMAIQRYLSTANVKAARKSFGISLITNIISYILLALVGLALLAYFTINKNLLLPQKSLYDQADTLFPRFILIALPAGVTGLLIAGLLAAAMSSMSSGLNSVSSVIYEDIIRRFRKEKIGNNNALKQVKRISYLTGAMVIAISFLINKVSGNLFDVVMKVVNLFVAPYWWNGCHICCNRGCLFSNLWNNRVMDYAYFLNRWHNRRNIDKLFGYKIGLITLLKMRLFRDLILA